MLAVPVTPPRRFVPPVVDFSNFESFAPLYQGLLDRPVPDERALFDWLLDYSELSSAVGEYGARRYIDKSCHTDDPAVERRYMQFVADVEPKIKPIEFQLQKKLVTAVEAVKPSQRSLSILLRNVKADVELFREENVAIETEVVKKVTDYDKLCGAMMVHFEGEDRTPQQMARYGEQTDRGLRERAWRATAERRLEDVSAIDAIFSELLSMREKIAANAGLKDYRDYIWKAYKRFDYTPGQCKQFADAIAETCVPRVNKLLASRKKHLKLEALRPWDLAVDPLNRSPLVPFKEGETASFVDKTREIFQRMSPELAAEFESLRTNHNLDLESRKGKQPGGYQSNLDEVKQPFIFMNAAGLQRDVETLLHEGGHAFHSIAASGEPLVFLRSAPMEFCEVASMSMELLGSDHFDAFYADPREAGRAKRNMLEGIIGFFPWMATIDSFQHWLYEHPGHTPGDRAAQWLNVQSRFGKDTDWTGLEEMRQYMWTSQLHLFHAPFYYVEYGIAQLGALQLWMKARQDPKRALSNYRAALKLGGTRPLPELFAAAGIRFDFSKQTLEPLMAAVEEELATLPE